MATVSSGVSLNTDYFLRKFYTNNRSAFKASNRKDFSGTELSYEDSTALHRAAKQLEKFKYSEDENKENINNSIKAAIETYNNALKSAGDNGSTSMSNYSKQLKSLSSKYSKDLEKIGITVNKDGSLSANENLIKAAKIDDIKSVMGNESGYVKGIEHIARKMHAAAYNDVYALATGNGTSINISL